MNAFPSSWRQKKYQQNVTIAGTYPLARPRELVSEFALVRSGGPAPWTGYRDVVAVNGRSIQDRRDRLVTILTQSATPAQEAARLMAESARYNIGPVSRNFNVPTTSLFFFRESNLSRFAFTRKGTKNIDGTDTIEVAFRERASPTLVTTKAGKDVPCKGSLWVRPQDGAIVRTLVQLEGFADVQASASTDHSLPAHTPPPAPAPPSAPAPAPAPSSGGGAAGKPTSQPAPTNGDPNPGALVDRFSNAISVPAASQTRYELEVAYHRDDELGMWLPARMSEEYEGVLPQLDGPPVRGIARGTATYSDFKRFETSATVKPKH